MTEQTALHEAAARAGAVFREENGWIVPDHFGDAAAEYDAARTSCVLFDQSPRSKVELTGKDAAAFLHNLCTNDIKNLPLGAGCEFFLTTNKAKVVAHGYVYHLRLNDGRPALWLDLEPGAADAVMRHLDHFLISEQVEIADRTREFAQMHLAGPQALFVIAKALGEEVPPLKEGQLVERTFGDAPCTVCGHDPCGVPGYDIVCAHTAAEQVWQMLLDAGAKPAGAAAFEILRVEAGTPIWGADIDENTFAPEVGRAAQAICYTKGCYLGQEPIVMARDRGQVNRTLLGVKLSSGVVPRGSLLLREGKEVGRVMSNVASSRLRGVIGLAYVRRGSQEPGTVLEVDVNGEKQQSEVVGLPFVG